MTINDAKRMTPEAYDNEVNDAKHMTPEAYDNEAPEAPSARLTQTAV